LSLLDVLPDDALFVGDDHRWDVVGAQNAGIRPVVLATDAGQSVSDHLTIQNLAGVLSLTSEAY
jgi:FMN phosphatase YigB (HAD superfamily)